MTRWRRFLCGLGFHDDEDISDSCYYWQGKCRHCGEVSEVVSQAPG